MRKISIGKSIIVGLEEAIQYSKERIEMGKEFNLSAHQKIYHIGDRHVKELFDDEVIIQEKVDGSQFGFAKYSGELYFRSKGKVLYDEDTTKSFGKIVLYLKSVVDKIPDGMVFYGEYLEKPRQNCLQYERIPNNHLAIFAGQYIDEDIWVSNCDELKNHASTMGFETVPVLYKGKVGDAEALKILLDMESFLGREKIEGFVVKNYHKEYQFANLTIPFLAGKYVREGFKERNHGNQIQNFSKVNKLQQLKDSYKTEARWLKAVQFLRDNGELTNTPKDIGGIMKRVNLDIIEEEKENIKETLYKIYSKEIIRCATHGLPEWWKQKLMDDQFSETMQ